MALKYQTVPIQFSGGLDQKSPEHLLEPGQFIRLENCVRRKKALVQKRFGFDHLGTTATDSTTISSAAALASYQQGLHLFTGQLLYAYAASPDKWLNRGTARSIGFTSYSVQRGTQASSAVSSAYNSGYVCYVTKATNAVSVSVYDTVTNQPYLVNAVVATVTTGPVRVVALEQYFYIIYVDGTDLSWRRIDTAAPSTLSAETSLGLANVSATAEPDVDQYDTHAAIVVYQTGSDTTQMFYLRANGTIGSSLNGGYPNSTVLAYDSDLALTVRADAANSRFFVGTCSNSTGAIFLHGVSFDFSFVASQLATSVATSGTGSIKTAVIGLTGNSIRLYYGLQGTVPMFNSTDRLLATYTNGVGWSGAIITSPFLTQSVPFSRPFIQNSVLYYIAVHSSSLQSTYFLVRENGAAGVVEGRYFAGTALADPFGVQEAAIGTSVYVPLMSANRLTAESGVISGADYGTVALAMAFTDPKFRTVDLAGDLHIAGGSQLTMFDGQSVVEHGFALYPEDLVLTPIGSGGSLSAGVYTFSATYEWLDNNGSLHRSAPSIPQVVTVVSNGSVQVTVPCLPFTLKTGDRSAIRIQVYRSIVDQDAVLYSDVSTPNVVGSPDQTLTSIQSDTAIADNEVLYTTGGVLENSAPPPAAIGWSHKNRLWLAGLEDANTLSYSKEYVPGEGVAFNDGQRVTCDPAGGRIRALSSLDDKLVIFKKDRIFTLSGDGPLATGAQFDYGQPQVITSDVGTTNPESICAIPNGVLFKSDKGIYILSRSLGTDYIGAPVEDFNDQTITSAVVREDDNEARFTTAEGTTLVYNYYFNVWSTFTNQASVSATSVEGTYYTAKSDGQVRKETADLYLDAGAKIQMAIETSWFAFAGIMGFQRIYELQFLGDRQNDHITKVSLAYDYENAYTEYFYFNVDTDLDLSYYGDGGTYGTLSPYGGPGSSVYQFRMIPRRQKCEAMKIRINDLDSTGASVSLVALTMMIGIKNTLNRSGTVPVIGGS